MNKKRSLSQICCYLFASLCLCVAAHAQEDVSNFVRFSVGNDNRVRVEVPSTTDHYYVLYYRRDADNAKTEIPVAIHLGESGTTTLTEPLGIGSSNGLYRVETFQRDAPGDVDGDGQNDVVELTDTTGRLSPLNPADPIDFVNGVTVFLPGVTLTGCDEGKKAKVEKVFLFTSRYRFQPVVFVIGPFEKGDHAVVVLLRNRIVFVVVAPGAFQSKAKDRCAENVDFISDDFETIGNKRDFSFAGTVRSHAQKTSRHKIVIDCVRNNFRVFIINQFISSDLFE